MTATFYGSFGASGAVEGEGASAFATASGLVAKVVAVHEANGREAALAAVSTAKAGDWHVFAVDAATGLIVAHPDAALVGARAVVGADASSAWVEYRITLDAATGIEEFRRTWAQRSGELVFAVGWPAAAVPADASAVEPPVQGESGPVVPDPDGDEPADPPGGKKGGEGSAGGGSG